MRSPLSVPRATKYYFQANLTIFFAKNSEFPYGIFVVSEPDESAIADILPRIVRAFLPNHSHKFEWKDVDADERKSSMYEVESNRRIALGDVAYLTFEYRRIDFGGKKLLTGTIVDGYEGPVGIRESFEKGQHTNNGGCFDSVDIIATFTKEKMDPEKGPCFFEITMSLGI